MRVYWLIEPEMSQSATIGGRRMSGRLWRRSIMSPPVLSEARSVRRGSMRPRGAVTKRRRRTFSIGITMRRSAALAARISSAFIWAKSLRCSSSRPDTVKRASISSSSRSWVFWRSRVA